jgi:hypothetical protein
MPVNALPARTAERSQDATFMDAILMQGAAELDQDTTGVLSKLKRP